jgi:hypothetical protein
VHYHYLGLVGGGGMLGYQFGESAGKESITSEIDLERQASRFGLLGGQGRAGMAN